MEDTNDFDEGIKNEEEEASSSVEIRVVNNHQRRQGGIELLEVASSTAEDDVSMNGSNDSVMMEDSNDSSPVDVKREFQSRRHKPNPKSQWEKNCYEMIEQIKTEREKERRRIFYNALGPGRKKKKKSKKRIDDMPYRTKNITADVKRKHPLIEENVTIIKNNFMAVVQEKEEKGYADHPMYEKENWITIDLSPYRYKEILNDVVRAVQQLPKKFRKDLVVRQTVINKVIQDPSFDQELLHDILQQVNELLQDEDDPEESSLQQQQQPMNEDEMLDRFCVQCNTFDCPLHVDHETIDGQVLEIDSKILIPMAMKYNEDREKKKLDEIKKGKIPRRSNDHFDHLPLPDIVPVGQGGPMQECHLSHEDKVTLGLLQRTICLGNYGMMNGATGGRYCLELTALPKPPPVASLSPDDLNNEKSRTITDPQVQKRIKFPAGKRRFFFPCFHSGPCTKENGCTCIKHKFLCTEQCINGKYGHNFFRGCSCTSNCTESKWCACRMGHIECNPQVCSCRCTRCKNRNLIGNNKGAKLIIAKSTIEGAGFGVFTKHVIEKDAYVGEVRCCNFISFLWKVLISHFDFSLSSIINVVCWSNN